MARAKRFRGLSMSSVHCMTTAMVSCLLMLCPACIAAAPATRLPSLRADTAAALLFHALRFQGSTARPQSVQHVLMDGAESQGQPEANPNTSDTIISPFEGSGAAVPRPPNPTATPKASAHLHQHSGGDLLPVAKPFIVSNANVHHEIPTSEIMRSEAGLWNLSQRHHAMRAQTAVGSIPTASHSPVSNMSSYASGMVGMVGTTAAGSMRALLHGTHNWRRFPKCRRCRMVRCRGSYCSGHCRQSRKFFFCDSNNVVAQACAVLPEDRPLEFFLDVPPANLSAFDTLVVTAPEPYIGCADVGNKPVSCPSPGSRAFFRGPRGFRATVESSSCIAQHYIPEPGCDLTAEETLFPFGVCECTYRVPGRGRSFRFETELCSTARLFRAPGFGVGDDSDEDELMVQQSGEVTLTWFSNFTLPGQEPDYTYNVTVDSGDDGPFNVSLSLFRALVVGSDDLQEGEDIDFGEDYAGDGGGESYDYVDCRLERENYTDGEDSEGEVVYCDEPEPENEPEPEYEPAQ